MMKQQPTWQEVSDSSHTGRVYVPSARSAGGNGVVSSVPVPRTLRGGADATLRQAVMRDMRRVGGGQLRGTVLLPVRRGELLHAGARQGALHGGPAMGQARQDAAYQQGRAAEDEARPEPGRPAVPGGGAGRRWRRRAGEQGGGLGRAGQGCRLGLVGEHQRCKFARGWQDEGERDGEGVDGDVRRRPLGLRPAVLLARQRRRALARRAGGQRRPTAPGGWHCCSRAVTEFVRHATPWLIVLCYKLCCTR
ncbi:hypothetical protein CFC21_035555 [Triticum aestivum]|uniref:Uncharacterized protein n=2 Tax=Triticum aestivum TaxID=4565 RepID=A0A9R1F7F6_WHEAT|nr:hypothetical protein CFC21_035555 [Triticum aestivum]